MTVPKPRRVLFLTPWGDRGGAEVVVEQIVRGLDAARYTPTLVTLNPGSWASSLAASGFDVVMLNGHRTRQIHRVAAAVRRLRGLVRDRAIDVVHATGSSMLLYASLAAGGVPVVWHVHDPLAGQGIFGAFFAATQRPLRPDWVVYGNSFIAEHHGRLFPRPKRSSIVTPGIDASAFADADGDAARAALGIPVSAPVIAMVGRLQRHKAQHRLVKSAHTFLGQHRDARVVLCGGALFGIDDRYVASLTDQIAGHPFADRILLTGHVADTLRRGVIQAADVVVHCADHEPFGLVVVEAMAAGRPIVVTDSPGPSALIEHGRTGLVVRRGDDDALARAIHELLSDPAKGLQLGRSARAAARLHLVEAKIAELESVYDSVISSRAVP